MSSSPFVTLIFRGKRFDEARMPLEALPELAAYRELVLAIAKALHQAEHPDRQRLPKGFEASFRLVLQRVEPGSAIPIVSRVVEPPTMGALFPTPDYFERARDLVQDVVAAAGKNTALPAGLSSDVLARFNSFGRTLGDDESIIVAQPGTREGAAYDRAVRRRLVLQAQGTYEDEVDLVGEVRSADKDAESFALRTADGRKLSVRTPPHFLPQAFRSMQDEVIVRVRGIGLYDAESTLLKVTMATDVSPAEEGEEQTRPGCPTPVETQLESLRLLESGWFDESSPAYEPGSLAWLSKLLNALLHTFQLPRPYIYPSPDGLARAEWSAPGWEIITSFDLKEHSAEALAVRLDADEQHEATIPLQEPGGESELGSFLAKHLSVHA